VKNGSIIAHYLAEHPKVLKSLIGLSGFETHPNYSMQKKKGGAPKLGGKRGGFSRNDFVIPRRK